MHTVSTPAYTKSIHPPIFNFLRALSNSSQLQTSFAVVLPAKLQRLRNTDTCADILAGHLPAKRPLALFMWPWTHETCYILMRLMAGSSNGFCPRQHAAYQWHAAIRAKTVSPASRAIKSEYMLRSKVCCWLSSDETSAERASFISIWAQYSCSC